MPMFRIPVRPHTVLAPAMPAPFMGHVLALSSAAGLTPYEA